MYKRFSPVVMILTLSGTLPFFGILFIILNPDGIVALVRHDLAGREMVLIFARLAMLGYAAVILSFLTGIRWGQGLTAPDDRINVNVMLLAGLTALLSWIALLVGYIPGKWVAGSMFIVAGCYLLLLAWDSLAKYPNWYFMLRVVATLCAVGCLCFAALNTLPQV